MPGYVRRGSDWWFQATEGSWTRWDSATSSWQPGTPPPPVPGEAPEAGWSTYRSVSFIWKVLAALLGTAALLDALAIVSDIAEYELLGRIATGRGFTLAEAEASDTRQGIFGILQTAIFIPAGIVFIVWLHRVYSNLRTLGVEDLRFRRWWTIGGWFIPIWGQFRPKQLVNDVWRGSDPSLGKDESLSWRGTPVPSWWIVWWLAFLLSNQAGYFAFRVGLPADTIDELQLSTGAYIAADSSGVVAGVLAILVVRAVSLRQLARAEHLGVEPVTP
jgi:hypothetical protein